MFHLPFLLELSPLYLAQAAFTIWMLIDANRREINPYWFWIILAFQPIGPWAYFFLYKVKDFSHGVPLPGNLFTRRPSIDGLRYRVEQSPTVAGHLELAERLIETKEYAEAEPHFKAVLARETEHGVALFGLAACYRQTGRPAEAVPLLAKLTARQANWRDYLAWHTLIDAYQQAGQPAEALGQARRLAQVAPCLQNKYLLARCLAEAGDMPEARRVVELGLQEYRFSHNPSRNDRRWVGRTKQLRKELE